MRWFTSTALVAVDRHDGSVVRSNQQRRAF
jgi:hypothetical protein